MGSGKSHRDALIRAIIACLFGGVAIARPPSPAVQPPISNTSCTECHGEDGKVTKIEWMNPHAFFYVDVKDDKTGQITNWAFELNSPNYLMRSGWTKSSLKVDDVVTVKGALARDGTKQVNASTVTMQATGKTLFAGSSDPNAPR